MPTTATQARKIDPTRTAVLRNRFSARYRAMWGRIERRADTMVQRMPPTYSRRMRVHVFEREFRQIVEEETRRQQYDRQFGLFALVQAAYIRGIATADSDLRKIGIVIGDDDPGFVARQQDHKEENDFLLLLLTSAYLGISNEVISQATQRFAASGEMDDVRDRVRKIGRTRSTSMIQTEIIRQFNHALLIRFVQGGVTQVGAIPELAIWETALDSRVCAFCSGMANADMGFGVGVYPIQQAMGLIPAHNRCRCRWRPIGPRR